MVIYQDREIKAMNMKLKQLREERDRLGRILDTEITEEERQRIVEKMTDLWEKIKEIKRL